MALEGSPLVTLAQQGGEVANLVVAKKSSDNSQREPSVSNQPNDWARRARSEAVYSASGNLHLADNDARRHITQKCNMRETGRDRDDLRNVIEDRTSLKARSPTPLR
jgi:hypothetical protein